MAKKEFPSIKELLRQEESPNFDFRAPKPRAAGFSARVFGIVKFILGLLLLPYVYSSSISLLNELNAIEKPLPDYLGYGVLAFLLIFFFIWEPVKLYTKGQRILEFVFQFFRPLVRVAPYLLPIYTIILLVVYGVTALAGGRSVELVRYFLFLFGFTMALHLVFSAKTLRSKQGDFLKGNYIFGFSFVYILNLTLLAFCLNLIFKAFSFVNFSNNLFKAGSGIIYALFRQLFL